MSHESNCETDSLSLVRKACKSCVGIDREIRRYEGLSCASHVQIDRQLSRKDQSAAQKRIVALNHENGMLKFESTYFETLANNVLEELFVLLQVQVKSLYSSIKSIHTSSSLSTGIPSYPLIPEYRHTRRDVHSMKGKHTIQSHPSMVLEEEMQELKPSHTSMRNNRPLPQPPNLNTQSRSDALETELTVENATMRLLIISNRKIVFRVLPRSLPGVCRGGLSLQSLGTSNAMLKQIESQWQDKINDILQEDEDLDHENVSLHSIHRQLRIGNDTEEEEEEGHDEVIARCSSGDSDGNLRSKRIDRGVSLVDGSFFGHGMEHLKAFGTVEPLNISATRFQSDPNRFGSCSATDLKRRIRMLQCQQLCYNEMIREASVRLIPMIKCHADELSSVLREYKLEKHKRQRTLQQELKLRGINRCNY